MSNLFLYYPYKVHAYFVPFAVVFCVVLGVFLCVIDTFNYASFFLLVIELGGIWSIKVLHESSKAAILFNEDGLQIKRGKDCLWFSWEQVKYGYYGKNYKGHSFLLLTANALDSNQVSKYINRGANTSKICIDSTVVFPTDNSQYTTELDAFIRSKVMLIDNK